MEYIDTFDINHNKTGVKEKDKAHLDGEWHQAFHSWIIRPNQTILFQLRSKTKSTYPDKLDISAAGHLSSGESVKDGIREIKEELGIDVDYERLIPLGRNKTMEDIPTKKGIFHDREFTYTFFLNDDTALDKYILQPEEVDGLYEMKISDGLRLFNNEISTAPLFGINRISKKYETITVDKSRFADKDMNYYLKVFIMADRFIRGEKYLAL